MLAQGTLLVSQVKTRRERIQQQRWTGPKALTIGLCAQEADMEVKLCTAKPQDDIMPHHHDTGPDRTPECRGLYKHSETFRERHKNKGKEWGCVSVAFYCQESFADIPGIYPVSSAMVNVNITVGTHICLLQSTPVCSTVNEWARDRSLAGQSLNISFASSSLYWNQPRVTYNPPMQLELFPKSVVKGKRHTYIFFSKPY